MSGAYNVVYKGRVLEGFDFEAAKHKLIEKFALSKEKAEKILKSRRVVLKRAVDEFTARKLGVALKRAGLDVILTKSPGDTAVQPQPTGSGTASAGPSDTAASTAFAVDAKPKTDAAATPTVAGPTSAQVSAVVPFQFTGQGGEYFKIWLVNSILTILTLGIYSAWAKVRRKTYIYGSTQLAGAGFEYLADPRKIFKGRVIAVAFLIIYSVLSNLFPQIGLVFSLGLLAVVPWIVVRALAFNARNSALRNIRFGFTGRVRDASKVFVLWPLLVLLTMGILAP